jgi:hypothetical protein
VSGLRHRVADVPGLSATQRARMLELMVHCYDGVDPARFASDLAGKQQVLLLEDGAGGLQGFSTLRVADESVDGRPVRILFSGDTVIHPDHWGSKALQEGFVAFAMQQKLRRPFTPLYWLLLTKGYKTYLLLTHYFPHGFPRRGLEPPAPLRALRDRVATAWWGTQYDAATEVLRFAESRDRVKVDVAELSEDALRDPDIAFFAARNPGWAEGDELVCLAELDARLPVMLAYRTARRTLGLGRRRRG